MTEEKIQLLHPAGKKNVRMDKKKYNVIREAILRHLKIGPLKHKELLDAILMDFRKSKKKFDGARLCENISKSFFLSHNVFGEKPDLINQIAIDFFNGN